MFDLIILKFTSLLMKTFMAFLNCSTFSDCLSWNGGLLPVSMGGVAPAASVLPHRPVIVSSY